MSKAIRKKIIVSGIIFIFLISFSGFIYWYFIQEIKYETREHIFSTRTIEVDNLCVLYALNLPATRYQKNMTDKITDEYVYEKFFSVPIYADEVSVTYEIKSRDDNALFVFEDIETGKREIGYFYAVIPSMQRPDGIREYHYDEDLLLDRILTSIYNIQSINDIKKLKRDNPAKNIAKNNIDKIYNIIKNLRLSTGEISGLTGTKDDIYFTLKTKHNYDIEFKLYAENKILAHNACHFIFNSDEEFEKLIDLLS